MKLIRLDLTPMKNRLNLYKQHQDLIQTWKNYLEHLDPCHSATAVLSTSHTKMRVAQLSLRSSNESTHWERRNRYRGGSRNKKAGLQQTQFHQSKPSNIIRQLLRAQDNTCASITPCTRIGHLNYETGWYEKKSSGVSRNSESGSPAMRKSCDPWMAFRNPSLFLEPLALGTEFRRCRNTDPLPQPSHDMRLMYYIYGRNTSKCSKLL